MHAYLPLAFVAASILLCLTHSVAVISAGDEETFDYLMLSQEWPYSFCTTTKCQNTDRLEPLFNIHGLWPEHVSGSCQGQFNFSELKPLETQLKQAWMDLTNPTGDPEKFWNREYDKHGRCATVDARFSTTFLYFKAALQLHNAYTLTEILAKSGIVPGPNPIKVSRILDTLTSSLGHQPELSCVTKDQTTYLLELRLCFEKDLSPRNCSSGSGSSGVGLGSVPLAGGSLKYDSRFASPMLRRFNLIAIESQLSPRRQLRAQQCNADAEVLLPDKLGD